MSQRILILTAGSQGDVQPYIALGKGLQAAGFSVQFATDASFAQWVTEQGLNFAPIQAPFAQLIQTEAGKAAIAGKSSFTLKQIMPMLRQMMDDSWAVADAFQPDAIVYHPKALAGYHIADRLGIPGFLAMALPGYSPTTAFANPIFGGGHYGGLLNWLSYTAFLKVSLWPFRRLINRWRQETLGLPPFQHELSLRGNPVPKLYAYSRHVVPIPPDWDDSDIVTGYWFLDAPSDWQPSADLVAFLDQGPPPVYIGFGSMAAQDATQTAHRVLEAVRQSGQRALLAKGWGGLSPTEVPETVHVLDSVPHDWLFPRCRAVVHHGGAGTTAAGLRAGKPTVICPFFGDQPFWGRRIWELGVGPKPLPQKRLTAEALAQAIRTVTTDTAMHQRAEALGANIRAENGVQQAVAAIRARL